MRYFVLFLVLSLPLRAAVSIAYPTDSVAVSVAVSKLEASLRKAGLETARHDVRELASLADVTITSSEAELKAARWSEPPLEAGGIPAEGYAIRARREGNRTEILVAATDATGAMYGTFDVEEQFRLMGRLERVKSKRVGPRFPFRAIKFNLPWSPYRSGPATDIHLDTCRDLAFWERFLNMMAENRFNVLSLWNLDPFSFMIRSEAFPEACPFSPEEMQDWKRFWRSLFRMAKDRGIETYIVNWNIVVSPEFAAAHQVKERNDTSEIVRRHIRQSVTQLINEYEDLTGLGVTLADWMNQMTPKEREDWIEETFVAGMKAARRPVKFIHRSVLAGDPMEMRRVIDHAELPDPTWVEVKFNWSHGHSTPQLAITHDYTTGQIDERFWKPEPENYKIVWMIRNEDFFVLRWGEPNFIRRHIEVNGHSYVGGYFVGSEGYIPAKDYSHALHPHQTWQYGFEKQWLFYQTWGRLLYDPETPDEVFEASFAARYGPGLGRLLLEAYSLASRMPLELASFHAATWDYTLYSEGFFAAARSRGLFDGRSPFISIDELINHETLDPRYVSIPDYVEQRRLEREFSEGAVTPLALAERLETDGRSVFEITRKLGERLPRYSGALECELLDVEAWAWLSVYFADKLRAGVALESFRESGDLNEKARAIGLLRQCREHWERLADVTSGHYLSSPHVSGHLFSWQSLSEQTAADIEIAENAISRAETK